MNEYLDYYFDLLINTYDMNVINDFLPTIMLDKTEQIIDLLILKLGEELQLSIELDDVNYREHIEGLITLLNNKKEKKVSDSLFDSKNILIFSPDFLKSLKRLNDSKFYIEIVRAIECLSSKEMVSAIINNREKYRRLHGLASGLSEVKTTNIRLMHMPINADFWYVIDVVKKEGNNKKGHQMDLVNMKKQGEFDINKIIQSFSVDGKIDYVRLSDYAVSNNHDIMRELERWGGKINEK